MRVFRGGHKGMKQMYEFRILVSLDLKCALKLIMYIVSVQPVI